ncbi:MAG: SDR family oxidoreductase [Rhodospirillaceae bacterium]|jgi:3-hydroxybutyrate dehydrogenase|nr:SDR family oxidoreductase [Rhodospirillaceae bacterium]MBT6204225.1 SDR family oxidoreductase [Rhodospirillaceae bacterium]MBT6510914.1 SDR family oxidoreductase [Rhodospirillaceae bacterium]MBT7615241.1 SDR family oxidoreductase [Rhodospirillaceae bacterium]MBT7645831.1 SDR family oxidoreductase [Rhodospirillaceae bacterium]
MSKRELEGRVALVTGGGSGQGRATALALAEMGADIVFGSFVAGHGTMAPGESTTYPSDEEMAQVKAAIEQHGVRAHGQHHDVRSDESCQDLVDSAILNFGGIDVLANVAGICMQGPISGHDDAAWNKVIDINLTGTYRMVKRCLPGMIDKGWGRIVIVASTAANVSEPNYGAYCASKAGVLGLMRCTALEAAPFGVTCNAINPGFVETGMVAGDMEALARHNNITIEEAYAQSAAVSPMNRMLQPEEIAAMAAFLCTDAARGITMEDINVAMGSLW